MLKITLPDGSIREFSNPITVMEVANDIGAGLAKATLGGKVDNKIVDSSFIINKDVNLSIITAKDSEGLEMLRHSCAHLLAQAVKELYPETEITIGPVIEDGFFYDFSRKESFIEKDLIAIEQKMKSLAKSNLEITCKTVSRNDAVSYFKCINEYYKAEIISSIPSDEPLTLYTQGDFTDLCRGPHVPHTGYLKAFKLMKISGAYWRADSNNEMLQRIYGTIWAKKEDLKSYLYRLEEAEKRDHRKLGKQLDLFHFSEESPGSAFWHPQGTRLWRVVEDYMRASNIKYGCDEIRTPIMADISLWEKSGHADKYGENMFMTHVEKRDYAIRPMNCPTCLSVYNDTAHSYRDLPIRMAEFGLVHRNEPSGSLHGLMRVRSFTQDDGHVFCRQQQIESEVMIMVEQCFEVYRDFGFTEFDVKVALRPDNRIGSDETWDFTENALCQALSNNNISYEPLLNEGAFYGPKIEFHLKDAIGRSWQCGTIQLDFSMPDRLSAFYIDEKGEKQVPAMLHRAIVGSLERFIGMLIEHYAGILPIWLSPTQIVIMGISSKNDDYARKINRKLTENGFRVSLDLRNEKIGFKIRQHTISKIPYFVVLGDKEEEDNSVSLRSRNGENIGVMTSDDLINNLKKEIEKKGR